MAKIDQLREEFAEYLYQRVPEEWRKQDKNNYLQFRRYLGVVGDVGFKYLITDFEFVLTFTDPDTCPEKYLPVLFASFGFPYFYDIPVQYQRRFLRNLIYLYKTKGTKPCIEYLARELSGFNASIDEQGFGVYDVLIRLLADGDGNVGNPEISVAVLERLLEYFLPVFVKTKIIVSYSYEEDIDLDVEEYDVTKIKDYYTDTIGFNYGSVWTHPDFWYTQTFYYATQGDIDDGSYTHTLIDDRQSTDYIDIIDQEDEYVLGDLDDGEIAKWTDQRYFYNSSFKYPDFDKEEFFIGYDEVYKDGTLIATYYYI